MPNRPGVYLGNHLPHVDVDRSVQHVTWHLADSIPLATRAHLEAQLATLVEEHREPARRKRYQQLLDNGLGSCVLRVPEVAAIVVACLRHHEGQCYRLHAWVVMPNHVHVLVEPLAGHLLGRVVQGWKTYTARTIRSWMQGQPEAAHWCSFFPSTIWHRDFWDRYIRDAAHYRSVVNYLENNPVAAQLAVHPAAWPWSSATGRKD